jgi:hypothetical protein
MDRLINGEVRCAGKSFPSESTAHSRFLAKMMMTVVLHFTTQWEKMMMLSPEYALAVHSCSRYNLSFALSNYLVPIDPASKWCSLSLHFLSDDCMVSTSPSNGRR